MKQNKASIELNYDKKGFNSGEVRLSIILTAQILQMLKIKLHMRERTAMNRRKIRYENN